MKKVILILFLSYNFGFSQNNFDLIISSVGFPIKVLKVGNTTNFTFHWVVQNSLADTPSPNLVTCQIKIIVDFPNEKYYTPSMPTGPGALFFDWVYDTTHNNFIGTQIQEINDGDGGFVSFVISGMDIVSISETNVTFWGNECFAANRQFNDKLSSKLKVEEGCILPIATLTGTQTIDEGQSANLTIDFKGAPPFNYILSNGDSGIANTISQLVNITPAVTSSYSLTEISNACGTGTFSGTATITVNCINMYTIKSGEITDPTVWSCGRVPTATDNVTISLGNVLNVPAGVFEIKNITLVGILNYQIGAEIKLTGL